MKKKPLVVLTGPTAVGKTKASIGLAKAIGGEIISADSMQVYEYMDIGSAKIRPEEMQGIPHYLIDELEPDEEFHVVHFLLSELILLTSTSAIVRPLRNKSDSERTEPFSAIMQ